MAFNWQAVERHISGDYDGGYDGDRPAMPRLWAFWGGGRDFNPADRAVGEAVIERFLQIESLAWHRLAFRSRVVRALVGDCGIDQILVAGVDMPMQDEVHTVAQSINPDARVVYADADELVMLHAQVSFTSSLGACGFVQAGLDDPGAVLDGAAATLDLDRPVAVLLINSLDVLDEPQAVAALSAFQGLAAGSHIAFCHLTAQHDRGLAVLGSMCADASPGPPCVRSPADLERLCAGMEMIPPGLVSAPGWRPDPGPWPVPIWVDLWCGVGRVPGLPAGGVDVAVRLTAAKGTPADSASAGPARCGDEAGRGETDAPYWSSPLAAVRGRRPAAPSRFSAHPCRRGEGRSMTSSNSAPTVPAHAAPPAPGKWLRLIWPLLPACMVIYPVVVYALNDHSDTRGLQLTVVAVLLAGAALLSTAIQMRHHEADQYHRHRLDGERQQLQQQVADHTTALQQMSSWCQHIDTEFSRLTGYLDGSPAPGTGELARYMGRTDEHLAAIAGHLEQLTHLQPAPPSGGADTGGQAVSDEPDREVLVYVGHRVHSLVSRQLAGFKAAEREEEDPERLDVLYGLDHLAVQLRRAAARLAVLGGRTARRAREPVPVSTLLRQAVTEIEDYDRVQLTLPDDDPRVAGFAGPDVIHVLAELLENATKFSHPDTAVLMSTRSMCEGLGVEIRDEGLPLKGEKLEELRRILAAPELISPREQVRQGQIGMLVAARLAARHNLRIELHPDVSGTRALVVVPHTLLPASASALGAPVTSAAELPRRRATTPAVSPAFPPAVAPAGQSVAVRAGAVPDETVFDTSGLNGSDTAAPGLATPPPVVPPSTAPASAAPASAAPTSTPISAPSASPGPATSPSEGRGGRPPLPRRSQAAASKVPAYGPASPVPHPGQPPTTGLMSKFTSGLRNAQSAQDDQRHVRPGQAPRPDLTGPGLPSPGLPGPGLTSRDRPDDPAKG